MAPMQCLHVSSHVWGYDPEPSHCHASRTCGAAGVRTAVIVTPEEESSMAKAGKSQTRRHSTSANVNRRISLAKRRWPWGQTTLASLGVGVGC